MGVIIRREIRFRVRHHSEDPSRRIGETGAGEQRTIWVSGVMIGGITAVITVEDTGQAFFLDFFLDRFVGYHELPFAVSDW